MAKLIYIYWEKSIKYWKHWLNLWNVPQVCTHRYNVEFCHHILSTGTNFTRETWSFDLVYLINLVYVFIIYTVPLVCAFISFFCHKKILGVAPKSLCNRFQVLCHQTGIILAALHTHSLAYCWLCILRLKRWHVSIIPHKPYTQGRSLVPTACGCSETR